MQENSTTCSASTSGEVNDQEFPALVKSRQKSPEVFKANTLLPAYQPSKITRLIEIPHESLEQKYEDSQTYLKIKESQNLLCSKIAREACVNISLNRSDPKMLVVVVSGLRKDVDKAEQMISAKFQRQETIKVVVPQEYHGFLIGKKGEKLRQLQATTLTHIAIPPAKSLNPDTITITGPRHGITEAERLIHETVQRQSQMEFEQLDIPKIYYPFIYGPNNQTINEIRERTDTKINIPPRNVQASTITISGKREGVMQAVQDIQSIYQQAKLYKTIAVCVEKSQHPLVFGARGSGLTEILAATGVSVEMPTDVLDEELTLRGPPEELGRALSMVYERAESSITEIVHAPNRLHKVLIGKRGAALSELLKGYEKVNIEFGKNQDQISIRGPPEEVGVIVDRLKKRIEELESTMAIDTIRVDPKYFRHIIGRQGATLFRLSENNVQIRMPTLNRSSTGACDEIVIEGDPTGIVKVKSAIQQLVHKLESEKCKDMIIPPDVQHLLRMGYKGHPTPIREIYDTFPKVSISWPTLDAVHHDPTTSVVQLRGDRKQVDDAADRLGKLIKQVMEENYRQEIHIFKDFRPHIFGKGFTKIQKLLDETETRIQYPNPSENSDVFTIIGREANVQRAIQQLEELQKKLANVKEIVVSIPSALTTKFVGEQHVPSLRSIRDQCPEVHIRLVNPKSLGTTRKSTVTHVDVIMLGPEDALAQAQKLVNAWNSRVAQMCAEDFLHVDPKFHGFLIGRHGSNLFRFRERHNVELVFPDRHETNSQLAREIRIVGSKEAVAHAKRDLEAMLKTMEDQVEQVVSIQRNYLPELYNHRRVFPQPELNEVRVLFPRLPVANAKETESSPNQSDENNAQRKSVDIKIIGPKAAVEAAVQALHGVIDDIEAQITREFPLNDPTQFVALDRARNQFREFEQDYRVFIVLRRASFDNTLSPSSSTEQPTMDVSNSSYGQLPSGCLLITGRPERIEQVYEEKIVPLLPVEEEFPLNKEFHRSLITVFGGERPKISGKNQKPSNNELVNGDATQYQSKATELRQKYGVFVRLPPQSLTESNVVWLRGTPSQLASARADLTQWVEQCESIKADRLARAYERSVCVPTRFIPSLVAFRPKLTAKHDVRMRFGADVLPTQTDVTAAPVVIEDEGIDVTPPVEMDDQSRDQSPLVPEEPTAMVTFRGYEAQVAAAVEEFESMVTQLRRQITEELYIPVETHSHLIGSRGMAIQKLMQEYKVRIEFPHRHTGTRGGATCSGDAAVTAASTVLVTGEPDNVDRACDYLIAKANDWMERYNSEVRSDTQRKPYRVDLLPDSSDPRLPI